MASFSALRLRRILLVSAIGLSALPAMAQQSTIPNVITGLDSHGGQKIAPVGDPSGGGVPVPVSGNVSNTPAGGSSPSDILTAINSPIPAGTAHIGGLSIDLVNGVATAAPPVPGYQPVAEPDVFNTGIISLSATGVFPGLPLNTAGYQCGVLQVTNTGGGSTLVVESRVAGATTFAPLPVLSQGGVGLTVASNILAPPSTTTAYYFPIASDQIQVRVSAFVSGTVGVIVELRHGYCPIVNAPVTAYASEGASAIIGNPFRGGGIVATAVPTIRTNGQVVSAPATAIGYPVTRPYSIPELEWHYAAASGGIASSTAAVTLVAANATLKNYLTSVNIGHATLSAATEFTITDLGSSAVLYRGTLQTAAGDNLTISLHDPLGGTTNSALQFQLGTSVTGAVYVNASGFAAP